MNFDYSDEQRALHESLTRWLDKHYTFAQRRERLKAAGPHDDATWRTLAEMGLLALPLPEAHGGLDGNSVDVAGVMAILGAKLVLEPYLPTVLAARVIADTGTPAQCERWLPEVAQGRLRLAFAHGEPGSAPCAHASSHHRCTRGGRLAAQRSQVGGGGCATGGAAGGVGAGVGCQRCARRAGPVRRRHPGTRCRVAQLPQPRRATRGRRAAARRARARCAVPGYGRRGCCSDRAHARPRRGWRCAPRRWASCAR